MANDYYFFTDINQQASNASDYINVQPAGDAYGPITPGTAGTDEYRITSLHTASYDPTTYAVCEGILESSPIKGRETALTTLRNPLGATRRKKLLLSDVGEAASLDDRV